jgi:hypothetical protein
MLVSLLATACGGRQLSAGDEDSETEAGTVPDLAVPDPPSCEASPPDAITLGPTAQAQVSSSSGKMFWEPDSQRLLLFGGLREPSTYDDAVLEIDPVTLESRVIDWAPGPSFEMTSVSAAKDPFAPRWWFVGGEHGHGLETEVLEVRLTDDLLSAKQLPALPSEVVDHGVGFDSQSGRLVYALGWDGIPPDTDYRDETWILRPDAPTPQWTLLPEAGGPPGQRNADMVWVPILGLLMLAHDDEEAPFFSGIWQLAPDSDVWLEHDIAPQPGHSGRARLFWDEPSCRVILWTDGYSFGGSETVAAIWIIDPFSKPMSAIELPRPEPAPTYAHNAGYDPVHRIVVEHGGTDFDASPSVYAKTIESYLF